jgi:chromosomal replication initiator protein
MMVADKDDAKQRWEKVKQRLRLELGEDLYTSWFARMELDEAGGKRLAVSVPTRFLKNWVETHYYAKLQKLSEAEFGSLDAVQIRVRSTATQPRQPEMTAKQIASRIYIDDQRKAGAVPATQTILGSPLDQTQTFDSFLTGPSNRLAHAAALRVAETAPGAPLSFNPLFIHSPPGLGKTHLLNATAWHIRETIPQRRVMMMTAERFMYVFVGALQKGDTIAFKEQFQSVDVLLIDDFQFLQGKTMQAEFSHRFNSLLDSKRQVIVAADVPPAQLDAVDQRMRSRLMGGLVVDIDMPHLELRRAILANRAAQAMKRDPSLRIPPEVLDFVANKITGGGRELDGALNRILAYHQFTGSAPLTLDGVVNVLRDVSPGSDFGRIKIEDILKIVGRHYNVARTDLLSTRRSRTVVMPRQVGMYLAKKLTPRSLPEIGRRFGGRDHSTVLHAVRKIEEQLKRDDRLAREVQLLTRLVEQQ